MMSSTRRIISAASVADSSTACLTCTIVSTSQPHSSPPISIWSSICAPLGGCCHVGITVNAAGLTYAVVMSDQGANP